MKYTDFTSTAARPGSSVNNRGRIVPACNARAKLFLAMNAVALLLPAMAVAQTNTQTIEKIEVTGSNIKRVDAETASPIQIITAEEIKRSGKQTITELLLRDLPSTGAGGLNDLAGAGSFSAGASTVSLRALGSAATLVLLNGRRIAPFGPADPNFGQSSAVNLDAIPLDVVERIEILKDGASAIYGSEAIAGVVNIILRKDFKGGGFATRGSTNYSGIYNTGSATGTVGFGDIAKDRYNVFVNAEVFSRERVSFRDAEKFLNRSEYFNSTIYRSGQRAFSSYAPQFNIFPGPDVNFVFNPDTLGDALIFSLAGARSLLPCPTGQQRAGQDICRFDTFSFVEVVPKSERVNVFSRGTIELSGTTSVFAEAGFNRLKTSYVGPPQIAGDLGSFFIPATNTIGNVPEVLPPGHPNNPTGDFVAYRYRFSDVGNLSSNVVSDSTRLLLGAKTVVGKFDVEAGALYSQNKGTATAANRVRASVFTRAVLDGSYNFTNPSAGRTTANDLRVNSVDTAKSSFSIVDVKASSELGALPGGPIGFATGLEFRREDRRATPDPLTARGEVLGVGGASAEGDRNVSSVYAELVLPVIKGLEIQLAGRSDKYSDYGRSTIPKVGIAWKVLPTVKLRASYAEGFRAPSLSEINKSSVTAFSTVQDPILCITGNEPQCAQAIGVLIQANPNVQPETAKTYNIGIVLEPSKDFSVSLDAYRITRRNEINIQSFTTILNNENNPSPQFRGRVRRGLAAPGNAVGNIQSITAGFFNSGETNVTGIDLDTRASFSLKEYGRVSTALLLTYTSKFEGNGAPGAPFVSFNGFNGYPRVRSRATANWDYRNFSSTLSANYQSSVKINTPGDGAEAVCDQVSTQYLGYCKVDDYLTVDIGTEYSGFKNFSLTATIQNLFNKRPPADPLNQPVNLASYTPYGAYFTLGLRYQFR